MAWRVLMRVSRRGPSREDLLNGMFIAGHLERANAGAAGRHGAGAMVNPLGEA